MKLHELPYFRAYFENGDIESISDGQFARRFTDWAQNDPHAAATLICNMMDQKFSLQNRTWLLPEEQREQSLRVASLYGTLAYRLAAEVKIRAMTKGGVMRPYVTYLTRDDTLLSRSLGRLRRVWSEIEHGSDDDECKEFLQDEFDLIYCDDCDEVEFREYSNSAMYGHDHICRSCIEDSYSYLERYDGYVHTDRLARAIDEDGDPVEIHRNDESFYYDRNRDTYVHRDYDPDNDGEPADPEMIHSYHSSKRMQSVQPDEWTKTYKRYLGVELEVEYVGAENPNRKAIQLNEALNQGMYGNKVFFERDGSVPNGFEIITQPMSLPAHRKLWSWLGNKDLVRHLRSHNTTTCGLHVHVSRDGLTPLQVAKIVSFVNNPDNEPLIRAVARRYAEGYCRIKSKKIGTAHMSEDRYEAVNVTGGKTIEFRVFKGSLKYESIISAIEFANAMVEFTRPYGDGAISNLKAEAFLEFIEKKFDKETKTLRSYINARLENA